MTSSPHSERLNVERAIERIEWMHYLGTKTFPHDAGWDEGCELCNAESEVRETLLSARRLEEQFEALDTAARRILDAPKGTSVRQFRFWLMDALGESYPASRQEDA